MPKRSKPESPVADAPAADPGPWWRRGTVVRRVALAALAIALLAFARPWIAGLPKGQARSALHDRRPEAALEWLRSADRLAGDDPEVAFLRARAFRKSGRFDETRDALLRAWKLGYPVERLEREQWLAFAQAGQLREADPHLSTLLSDPRDDAGEICEAFVTGYIRTHRVADAFRMLDSWAADFPDDPMPPLMRGKLCIELAQWEDAEAALTRAAELRPGDFETLGYLADVSVERRKLAEALSLYERCLDAAPDEAGRARAKIGRVRCLRTLGRPDDAKTVAQEVLRERPSDRDALIELGRVEAEAGRFNPAVAALEKADAASHHDIEVRYAWAGALRGAGRVEEAGRAYGRIGRSQAALSKASGLIDRVVARPNDVDARLEVGRIFLEHGDPEKGILWLQSVFNYAPDHGPTCRLLAEHYERRAKDDPKFAGLAREFRRKADAAVSGRDAATRPETVTR